MGAKYERRRRRRPYSCRIDNRRSIAVSVVPGLSKEPTATPATPCLRSTARRRPINPRPIPWTRWTRTSAVSCFAVLKQWRRDAAAHAFVITTWGAAARTCKTSTVRNR